MENGSTPHNSSASPGAGSSLPTKKRRRRTSLEQDVKLMLEALFSTNQKPTTSELCEMGSVLNLDKDVVRVWFCNRRQKEKKLLNSSLAMGGGTNTFIIPTDSVAGINTSGEEFTNIYYTAAAVPAVEALTTVEGSPILSDENLHLQVVGATLDGS